MISETILIYLIVYDSRQLPINWISSTIESVNCGYLTKLSLKYTCLRHMNNQIELNLGWLTFSSKVTLLKLLDLCSNY
jgi:hypothetical protein